MKPSANTVISEYNRLAQARRNRGETVDHFVLCNLIVARYGYRLQDVFDVMEGNSE